VRRFRYGFDMEGNGKDLLMARDLNLAAGRTAERPTKPQNHSSKPETLVGN
jgi:hypothetical protein